MTSDQLTRLLGVLGTASVIAFVLVLRARTASGAGGEAIILFIVLAPAVGLLCLAALVMLIVGLTRGQVRPLTWLAVALPAALGVRLLGVLAGWPLSLEFLNG